MQLDVKYYKQDKDYTCGPVALQMVMEFLGHFRSEGALARITGSNPHTGTSHEMMEKAAKNEGFFVYSASDSPLDFLKKATKNGLPVIVNFIEPADETAHYAVVVGVERGNLVLNDPWNGKGVKISEKEFLSRWHNGNRSSWHWAMIIDRQKPDWLD